MSDTPNDDAVIAVVETSPAANDETPTPAPFSPTIENSPASFNLVIVPNDSVAKKIVEEFTLRNVFRLDQIPHLPSGGPARGEMLNRILGERGETATLIVFHEEVWLDTLLTDNVEMAPKVWRAIESKLLGHHTERHRELLIVANNFTQSCADAERDGALRFWTHGNAVPASWKPPRPPREKPTPKPKPAAKVKDTPVRQNVVFPDRHENARKHRTSTVPNFRLQDDLYLLVKGHYGAFLSESYGDFEVKTRAVIKYHMGVKDVPDALLVGQLFKTLIGKGHRGYWGGFNLLQDAVLAGGQAPWRVAEVLFGWIAGIPARDSDGKEIPQPVPDQELYTVLARL